MFYALQRLEILFEFLVLICVLHSICVLEFRVMVLVLYLFYVPCLVYLFIIIVCLRLYRTVLLSYFITFSGMISPTASPHLKLPRYFCCDFCFRINFLDVREGSYSTLSIKWEFDKMGILREIPPKYAAIFSR